MSWIFLIWAALCTGQNTLYKDVDVCENPALGHCSLQSRCKNTPGSSSASVSRNIWAPRPLGLCAARPNIDNLWSTNVTATSLSVHWSGEFLENQTFQITLIKASEVVQYQETSESVTEIRGLQPGQLYNVTVTPCARGGQGDPLHMLVRTDAQVLDASTRITNLQFTADLKNRSSRAYRTLSASFVQEIYRCLSPDSRALVDSGRMAIEIRSFSEGSVVVNFTLTLSQTAGHDISNISTALLQSLNNSSKYTVDNNNTNMKDVDECASGANDCSQWAMCTNTWASYTCTCLDGFSDSDPERPGRTCQAKSTLDSKIFSPANPPSPLKLTGPLRVSVTGPHGVVSTTGHSAAPRISRTSPHSLAFNSMLSSALSVHCRVAAITVTVLKRFLSNANIPERALYLGMLGCGVNGNNETHVQLTVAWDECATRLVHNESSFTALVTLFNTMDPFTSQTGSIEVPNIHLEVPIMCTYMKSLLMSADLSSVGVNVLKDVILSSGVFPVTVQLTNGSVPLSHNYSLSPEEALVVEVRLNSSSEQIKVIANRCWATASQNPADTQRYSILENSCPVNMYTKVLMNGRSTVARVSVQIFSFVKLGEVFLHCQVQICLQIGSNSCVPDCFQRSTRTANIVEGSVGSSGPILRMFEVELDEKLSTLQIVGFSCLGAGLSLFFVFGLICLFYCHRNRIGNFNFNTQPKPENFTTLTVKDEAEKYTHI